MILYSLEMMQGNYHLLRWLPTHFIMKHMGETSYVLRINLITNWQQKTLGFSQALDPDKIFSKFSMDHSKEVLTPFWCDFTLSFHTYPSTQELKERKGFLVHP